MNKTVSVVALVGSLREKSLNRVLAEAAAEEAPDGLNIEIYPLDDLPIYNWDVEQEEGFPDEVVAFHHAIDAADALLLVTPEYNGSYSGVIKNAIDWASRGGKRMAKKPVATMSGTPGALGGTKAQEHLKAVCLHLGMYLLSSPRVAVPNFNKKIEDGRVTDDQTRTFIRGLSEAFYDWILKFE